MIDAVVQSVMEAPADAAAVTDLTGTITYGDLVALIQGTSDSLRELGVSAGNRVALRMPFNRDSLVLALATRALGAACCPLMTSATAAALSALEPDFVLDSGELVRRSNGLRDLDPEGRLSETDTAWIVPTSGSSGRVKLVCMPMRAIEHCAREIAPHCAIDSGDEILCALSLAHAYGLGQVLCGLALHATLRLPASFLMADLRAAAALCSVVPVVPLQLQSLHGLSPRFITLAGQAVGIAERHAMLEAFPRSRFRIYYGLTEAIRILYLDHEDFARDDDVTGKAFPGSKVWLEDGELYAQSPTVGTGYLNDADRSAERFTGPMTLRTGDLFEQRGEFFHHRGRVDRVFKCRGEKVAPDFVEQAIRGFKGVSVCVVKPFRGDDGELYPRAQLQAVGAVAVDELRRYLRKVLPAPMIPVEFEISEHIATTDSGKPRYGATSA